jgi:hypothetical protein
VTRAKENVVDGKRIYPLSVCHYGNTIIYVSLAIYFFFIPFVLIILCLDDPGLKGGGIPNVAFSLHKRLSPRFEKWAKRRVKLGLAEDLSVKQIAATEWPLFGSVFYLWATEALQEAWEQDKSLCPVEPKAYACGAIESATALVADPSHANWVREHWGDDYLEKENLFYRMLLISGLTSYQKLSGETKYETLLRSQVESLANELDQSPYGLLDDYPGQCYPVDILPAIAAIRRADAVLGTDHTEFTARAIRGFQGTRLDEDTGLPAYFVDSKTGCAKDAARGVGLSFMLIWAPELWPGTARDWYTKYEEQFWQEGRWMAGFREYSKDIDVGWFVFNDVDAGPIVGGYGVAASAFGIGAARTMGRFDHAYILAAQAIAGSWPLPDGILLVPRVLSNMSDAPYLGEAALLFALTRMPVGDANITGPGRLPAFVYIVPCLYLGLGIFLLAAAMLSHKHRQKQILRMRFPFEKTQLIIWMGLVIIGMAVTIGYRLDIGILLILLAQLLPRGFVKKTLKEKVNVTSK